MSHCHFRGSSYLTRDINDSSGEMMRSRMSLKSDVAASLEKPRFFSAINVSFLWFSFFNLVSVCTVAEHLKGSKSVHLCENTAQS